MNSAEKIDRYKDWNSLCIKCFFKFISTFSKLGNAETMVDQTFGIWLFLYNGIFKEAPTEIKSTIAEFEQPSISMNEFPKRKTFPLDKKFER